ncbi:hypothetical protein ACFQ07_17510, partial [Actinomadura adrarensis]
MAGHPAGRADARPGRDLPANDRRAGGTPPAVRLARIRQLTVPVVRIIGFNVKSMHSLVLWVLRRRSGVPPGAVEASYAREELFMMSLWQFAMVVEAVGVDILLRGLGAPEWLRIPLLVIGVYGVIFGIGVLAASATRPHVITDDELRIRYGPFFDLRIPRDRITSVRPARNRDEKGLIMVADGTLAAAVTAQTNLIVELDEPITVIRPMGRRAE